MNRFCSDCMHCTRRILREPMCSHPSISDQVSGRPLITARIARQVFCGSEPAFWSDGEPEPEPEPMSERIARWFPMLIGAHE